MEETTLNVAGMTCQGCVSSVSNALRRIPGVTKVRVSLEQASATVEFDAARTQRDALKSAVEGAGFEVT